MHRNVASGVHTVVVTNDSTDNTKDMVYVDGFQIYGGDVSTPATVICTNDLFEFPRPHQLSSTASL